MSNSKPTPGSLDFELTDLGDARRALDLPPPGLIEAQQMAPDYWTFRRRSPIPTDRALTGDAMDWAVHLPAEMRPIALCEQFPRIANAIAQTWAKRDHCESLLASLLTDRRGKRRGFPAEVQVEIERLARYRVTIT
jgi:hypothetical protein